MVDKFSTESMFEEYDEKDGMKMGKASRYGYQNRMYLDNSIPNLMDRFKQKGRKKKLEEVRNYVWEVGLLHKIIKMKVDFVASGFDIVHPDSSVEKFYNDIYEDLDIIEFIKNAAFEHEVIGEWYPFINWENGKPKLLTILDPQLVKVKSVMGNDLIYLYPSDTFQDLLSRKDPDINRRLLKDIPSRFKEPWRRGEPVLLNEDESKRYNNLKPYHKQYAKSPLEPIIPDLELLKTLIAGDYSIASKIKKAILHVKIGDKDYDDGDPVDPDMIDAVEDIFNNPSQAMELFTQWFVDHEWIVPDTDVFTPEKYKEVYKRIMDWSGLNVMISSDAGGYGSSYIQAKGFKQDIMATRQKIKKFLDDLNKMIAKKNNMKTYGQKLKIPNIKFSKTSLKDDSDILSMVQFLYKHGLLSMEDTLDSFDYDFETQIRKKMDEEQFHESVKIPFEPSQGLLDEQNNGDNNRDDQDIDPPRN